MPGAPIAQAATPPGRWRRPPTGFHPAPLKPGRRSLATVHLVGVERRCTYRVLLVFFPVVLGLVRWREEDATMSKLRVSRGAGRRASSPPDATTLAPSVPVPSDVVGVWGLVYRLSGGLWLDRISGRRSGTQGRVQGRSTAAGPGGDAAHCEASVVPPPLFPPAELAPAASAESHAHSQWTDGSSPPATRKRVVLLPHAQIKPR